MADTFASQVFGWAGKTVEQQTAVLHESIRGLDREIAKDTPVVTGNLRNSREVSPHGPPTINWKTKKFRDPSDTINSAIAGVEVGTKAYLGFRAPYAFKVEAKHGFMRLAAQRWSQIVDEAVRDIKGRSA